MPIDTTLVPIVAGLLRTLEQRDAWVSDDDFEQGYNAIAELQTCMSGRCIDELVEAQERTYRLLDRALNGVIYTAVPNSVNPVLNPPAITPAIPDVPPLSIAPGLLARFERLLALQENQVTGRTYQATTQNPLEPALLETHSLRKTIELLQGVLDPGWFGIGGNDATLADVVRALRIGGGEQKTNVLAAISQILGSGGSAATIFGTVQDLFSDTVDLAADGAMIAVLIASTLAGAAIAAQQQIATTALLARLDLVLTALRGPMPPADNILQALRGDEDASATRNIITSVS